RITWTHLGRDSWPSGGSKVGTSKSTLAGEHSTTRTKGIVLTQNTPPTESMLQQTRTVPVIFVVVADPVGSGFVGSLARPGGNATGFTVMEPTTSAKWLELLKEIAPRVNRAAFLFNPATAPFAHYYLTPFNAAAASLGVQATVAPVHSKPELESVI